MPSFIYFLLFIVCCLLFVFLHLLCEVAPRLRIVNSLSRFGELQLGGRFFVWTGRLKCGAHPTCHASSSQIPHTLEILAKRDGGVPLQHEPYGHAC